LLAAIRALGELGGSRSLELIKQALIDSPRYAVTLTLPEPERTQFEAWIRSDAATSLGKISGAEAVQLLIRLVTDTDDNVRWSAVETLQQVNALAVEPLLAELQATQNEDARWSILWALNKMDDPRAQAAVEAARATYQNYV
jgi:HEAT repeat protein